MKILSRVIDRVKSVYQYEKTTHIDAGAIQNVMIIFVIVMMLINIQNFRLGEYISYIINTDIAAWSKQGICAVMVFSDADCIDSSSWYAFWYSCEWKLWYIYYGYVLYTT